MMGWWREKYIESIPDWANCRWIYPRLGWCWWWPQVVEYWEGLVLGLSHLVSLSWFQTRSEYISILLFNGSVTVASIQQQGWALPHLVHVHPSRHMVYGISQWSIWQAPVSPIWQDVSSKYKLSFDEYIIYILLKRQWRWFENLGMPLLETKQPAGGKSWVSQQWAVIIIIRSWGKNGCPNMRRYTRLSNGIETWTNAIHQVLDNEMGFLCFLNKGYRPTFVVPSNRPLGVVWVWLHGPRQGVMSCSSPCWASHVAPPPERPIRVNQSDRWYETTKKSTELTFTNAKNV